MNDEYVCDYYTSLPTFQYLTFLYFKDRKNYVTAYQIQQRTGNKADVLPKVHFCPLILE